jgi:hypothetical protein
MKTTDSMKVHHMRYCQENLVDAEGNQVMRDNVKIVQPLKPGARPIYVFGDNNTESHGEPPFTFPKSSIYYR